MKMEKGELVGITKQINRSESVRRLCIKNSHSSGSVRIFINGGKEGAILRIAVNSEIVGEFLDGQKDENIFQCNTTIAEFIELLEKNEVFLNTEEV